MYTVKMEHECACFKRSEYQSEQTFNTQKDAYDYTNVVTEFMNEDFCTKHLFVGQRTQDDNFVIQVVENPNAGSSCSTGSCGPSDAMTGCGTSCGC